VNHGARGPERIVGARHEHLVAGIEQGPHGEHDQLGNAVADEHILGRDVHHAADLLLHHHRLAGRKDPLLMRVGIRLVEVRDHRHPHRLRHPESERAGVADVELDDLVPLAFELFGAARERSANLVPDVVEVLGGPQRWKRHGGVIPGRAASCPWKGLSPAFVHQLFRLGQPRKRQGVSGAPRAASRGG